MMTQPEDQRPEGGIGVTEGVRRTTGVTPIGGRLKAPDPEVVEKKARRRFTAQYKLRILEEADACTASGQIGGLLRREGLYFSNLTTWRRQRDEGQLRALSPKKRGRKQKPKNPLAERVAQLERERTGALNIDSSRHRPSSRFKKKSRTSWGSPNRTSTTTGAAHEGGHGVAHRGRNHTGMRSLARASCQLLPPTEPRGGVRTAAGASLGPERRGTAIRDRSAPWPALSG